MAAGRDARPDGIELAILYRNPFSIVTLGDPGRNGWGFLVSR